MSYKTMAILCLFFLCTVSYVFTTQTWVSVSDKTTDKVTPETYETFEAFWVDYIKKNTPAVAYAKFKESYANALPTEKHLVAHLFGGALYKSVGVPGLSVCDMDYSSGCFHEFLGRALQDHGESILHDVDTYCKESNFDCQHGIGHGLLAYSGYEYTDLLEALDMCSTIGTTDIRDGCLGGIFMEYNVRTMLSPEVSARSQEQTEVPDDLCQRVPENTSQACYFWLPQWLLSFTQGSLYEKFFDVAQECQTVINIPSRLTCYSGLTNELISHTDDMEFMEQYCDDLKLSKNDPLYRVQCRSGIASSLFMDINTRGTAIDLCQKLSNEEYVFCEFYAVKADGKRIVPYTQWRSDVE